MQFLIIVKASKASEAGIMPDESVVAEMAKYHEELERAGMLLDASGLQPSARGWRVQYSGTKRNVVEGPFGDARGLVAGYTLFEAGSREEALEWTRRFPNPAVDGRDAEIEVRQLFETDDFAAPEAVERFRELGIGAKSSQ